MMSKGASPLELLADVSRQFPELRFAVEWDMTDDGPCGCATIADGVGAVVHLEKPVSGEPDYEEEVELRWDVIQETSRLLFGGDWKDIYRPCDGPDHADAKELAMRSVAERSDLAEEICRLQQREQDLLSIALRQRGVSKAPSSPPTSDEVLSMVTRKENSTYIIEPVYRNRKQTGEYRACRTPKNWPTPSWEHTKDVPWEMVLPNEEQLEKWLRSVAGKQECDT
jgi:hypothetical protein